MNKTTTPNINMNRRLNIRFRKVVESNKMATDALKNKQRTNNEDTLQIKYKTSQYRGRSGSHLSANTITGRRLWNRQDKMNRTAAVNIEDIDSHLSYDAKYLKTCVSQNIVLLSFFYANDFKAEQRKLLYSEYISSLKTIFNNSPSKAYANYLISTEARETITYLTKRMSPCVSEFSGR